jgi:hypothetical protein
VPGDLYVTLFNFMLLTALSNRYNYPQFTDVHAETWYGAMAPSGQALWGPRCTLAICCGCLRTRGQKILK